MANFILGLAIVIGGWWIIRSFASAQPAQVRGLVRKVAGGGVMVLAAVLAMRGGLNLALPLFMLGLGLMGQQMVFPNGMPWAQKSPGQASRVSTSILAMELDHDSGQMRGEVLAGPLRGRKLASLTLDEARQLHGQCAKAPDQSRALFEAWIERNHPEWRARWTDGREAPTAASSPKMTRPEALAILGLKPDATVDDIRAAHRRLMKTAHPDMGGSDYLAAKVNEAKEFLLQDAA